MASIRATRTMLEKSICDCNADVRELLKERGLVDYDNLKPGDRVVLDGRMSKKDVKVSCYRAKNRGDKRIWITGINKAANPGDNINLKVRGETIHITVS
tara:strand:+ start:9655 stop:9951 length:297 start_codon:yes stop_codon:yes gene_type:complete